MLPALLSIPAKMATLLARLTSGRASNLDNLDAAVTTRSTLTLAQAASAVWGAATRTLTSVSVTSIPSIVASIQRVSGDMSAGISLDITITAVTVAKSVVIFAGCSGPAGGGMDFFPRATLVNSTTLRLSRGINTGTTQYSFFVLEFE